MPENIDGNIVIHFLDIEETNRNDGINAVPNAYLRAQAKARSFGGRKFHNKSYGGGIAFKNERDCIDCLNAHKVN